MVDELNEIPEQNITVSKTLKYHRCLHYIYNTVIALFYSVCETKSKKRKIKNFTFFALSLSSKNSGARERYFRRLAPFSISPCSLLTKQSLE